MSVETTSTYPALTAKELDKIGTEIAYQPCEQTSCPISMEEFKAEDTVFQLKKCSHMFCTESIEQWLRTHRTCPMCRCKLRKRFKREKREAMIARQEEMVDADVEDIQQLLFASMTAYRAILHVRSQVQENAMTMDEFHEARGAAYQHVMSIFSEISEV
jgi:hypothetical protein